MKLRKKASEGRTTFYALAVVGAGILVALGAAMAFFSAQPEDEATPPAEDRQEKPTSDSNPSTDSADAEQAKTDADADNDADAEQDENDDGKEPEGKGHSSESPELPDEELAELPFEEAMRTIRRLERDARFFEAQKLLAELDEHTEDDRSRRRRIAELRSRLNRWRARAGRALPHLPKLGSDRQAVRRAAVERILAAGEVALILLRKEVRTANGRRLQTALDILVEQRDWRTLDAVLERLLRSPEHERTPLLVSAAEMLLTDVPENEYTQFRAPCREIAGLLRASEDFSKRRTVGLLPVLLEEWFDGDEAALNRFLEIPEASVLLNAYVRATTLAEDSEIAEWGGKNLLKLGAEMPSIAGWWRFNRTGADRIPDWSGHGHDGTRNGGVFETGKLDGALRLNGEGEFVRIADTAALSGGEGARVTGSVLFRVENTNGFKPLVEKQWGGTTGDWGLNVSGAQLGYYSEATGNDYHLTGGTVQPDTWHHAAFVLEQENSTARVSLYLDGKPVAAETPDQVISADTDGDVFIGARFYNNEESKGYAQVLIDDVRLFDRALNGEEIGQLQQGLDAYLHAGAPSPEAADNLAGELLKARAENSIRILADALSATYQSIEKENRTNYRSSLATLHRSLADAQFATLAEHRKLAPLLTALKSWFDGDIERGEAWLESDAAFDRLQSLLQAASQSEDAELKKWAERHADLL